MNSRAKAFQPSTSAAARSGPKTESPRRRNSSPMPRTRGSSGPTTVKSALMVCAKSATSTMLEVSMGTQSAKSAIPALPGAQYTSSTRGLWRIFRRRACSRPPLPTTRTFTGGGQRGGAVPVRGDGGRARARPDPGRLGQEGGGVGVGERVHPLDDEDLVEAVLRQRHPPEIADQEDPGPRAAGVVDVASTRVHPHIFVGSEEVGEDPRTAAELEGAPLPPELPSDEFAQGQEVPAEQASDEDLNGGVQP